MSFLKGNKRASGKKFKQVHGERTFKAILLGFVSQQPESRGGISEWYGIFCLVWLVGLLVYYRMR